MRGYLWLGGVIFYLISVTSVQADQLPGNLTLVGQVDIPGGAGSVAVSGQHAYLSAGVNGLRIVDVGNPSAPAIVGAFATNEEAHGLAVSGNLVYLANKTQGIKIINVSNPSNPTLAGQFIQQITGVGPPWALDVAVQGNFAYISHDFLGGLIVNVSNPANPQMVGWLGTPSWSREFVPSGNLAYHAHSASGLLIKDITTPSNAQQVGSIDLPGACVGVFPVPPYAYVAGHTAGLHIVNVSTPTNPTLIATYDTPGIASKVFVEGSYAYIADGSAGVQVINISDPANPVLTATYDTNGSAGDIFVAGDLVYVADGGGGLAILQFTPPPELTVGMIYWTDPGANKIQRSNLDGSNVEDLVTAGLNNPTGIALDTASGKMYWTVPSAKKIQRSNLDGSNVEDLITAGLNNPIGIALDVIGGKIYWTDDGSDKIQRSNLNGSNIEDLVTTGLSFTNGIALDVVVGKIYWTDQGTDKIQRSNLDGSNIEDLVTTGLNFPIGIALDVVGGKMYWVDRWTRKIQRSNLNGSNVEDLVTTGLNSPEEIALDVAGGKMYWTEAGSGKIQRANLDGSSIENLVTGLSSPEGIALDVSLVSPPATVAIDTAFGAPGDTLRIAATMTSTSPVGGLQFSVILGDTTQAHFTGLEDIASIPDFTVSSAVAGDTTKLVVFSGSGADISPGTDILLATLVYWLKPSAALGNTVPLTLTGVVVSDTSGVALSDSTVDGELQVGIRGDVTLDGLVSILDVVRTVRIIIGKDVLPVTGTTAFNIADMNRDGSIDIADVVSQVNAILGIAPKMIVSAPALPVAVRLEAETLPDGQRAIPLVLEANGIIAGVQATFTFDPSLLEVGTPQFMGITAGLALDSHVIDGELRVVAYSVTPGQGIPAGQHAVLQIPVKGRNGVTDSPSLTLADVILVDAQAQRIPVILGETTVSFTKEGGITPTAFALYDARPNPFNPSTTISYETAQQAHITLTIYNLLGQEVTRLVDEQKSPGRYTVMWSGRNAKGLSVASGVYVYRMTSSTGFIQIRRMVLIK